MPALRAILVVMCFAAPGFAPSSDVWGFLRYLALAQPASGRSVFDGLPDTGEFNLIVTARPEASLPHVLRTNSRICTW